MDATIQQQKNNSKSIVVTPNPSGMSYYPGAVALRGFVPSERNGQLMSSDSMREAMIQRELEKERIREEIMYEIMRKRELEAEVRRELAMEEFALRYGITQRLPEPRASLADRSSVSGLASLDMPMPVSFTDRLPSTTEVESDVPLPFQRNPEAAKILEINKAQLKDMAKPFSALVGKKRNLDVVNDSTETSSSKKNTWDCTICNISTTSESNLKVHLQGKKHKFKANNMESLGKGATRCVSKKAKKQEETLSEDDKKLRIEDLKKKFPFCCVDCMVGCHTEDVLMRHCCGRKHISRMEAPKLADGTASSGVDHEEEMKTEGPEESVTEERMVDCLAEARVQVGEADVVQV